MGTFDQELLEDLKAAAANTKGSQHYPETTFRWDPLYLLSVPGPARDLFEHLSFLAWKENNLIVKAAAWWAARGAGIGERSAERHYKTLERLGLIRVAKRGRKKANWYFVEPFLIGEFFWLGTKEKPPLENLEESHLFKYRHRGGTNLFEVWVEIEKYRQSGGSTPPEWRYIEKVLGTEYRHRGGQIYYFYSFLWLDALRQCAPGGGDLTGKDKNKGVGPPADNIAKKAREEVEAKVLADANAENQKKKKPVRGQGNCKAYAHADSEARIS